MALTNIVSASDGTSVYVAGAGAPPKRPPRLVPPQRQARCLGRGRAARGAAEPPHLPHGRRAVMTVGPMGQGGQLWIYDLTGSRQPSKLTFSPPTTASRPGWSTGGGSRHPCRRVRSTARLFSLPADGSSTEPGQRIGSDAHVGPPLDWSPEPGFLLVQQMQPRKLALLNLVDRTTSQWLQTRFRETGARFSPDGLGLAYAADVTGRVGGVLGKPSSPRPGRARARVA